ncbi:MAG: regulatory protein RecX [Clostridia bacterium]|nr:regulatory protein RecX [Clostridia bacterium]MBQ9774198.1 regulatory protein RecX [Clostridia bacterium]
MTNNPSPLSASLPVTITVRALRAQHDGAEVLVQVLLDNGEHREQKSLPVTMEQYCELKPQKGQISEELYDRLEEASRLCQALRSGENLLSFGANSVQMLARKLMQRGYSREVAQAAAERLASRGLIDEEKDVRREVEKCLRKLWGQKRISAHLWSRGFASESLSGLSELFDEVDFAANCALLIRKKYGTPPHDPDEHRRMVGSLCRYGYSIVEIREALRQFTK